MNAGRNRVRGGAVLPIALTTVLALVALALPFTAVGGRLVGTDVINCAEGGGVLWWSMKGRNETTTEAADKWAAASQHQPDAEPSVSETTSTVDPRGLDALTMALDAAAVHAKAEACGDAAGTRALYVASSWAIVTLLGIVIVRGMRRGRKP